MDREIQKIAVEVTDDRIRPLDVFGVLFEQYEDKVQSYSDNKNFDKFKRGDLWRIIGADNLDEGFWIWEGRKKTIETFVYSYTMQGNWRKATDKEIEKMKSNDLWGSRLDIEEDSDLEPALCVHKSVVEEVTSQPDPFVPDDDHLSTWKDDFEFRNRGNIEEDPTYKQLIPYVLIQFEDKYFFSMQRKTNQSESRLHNKKSLGVGGHVPKFTWQEPDENIVDAGMYRELDEEVFLPLDFDLKGPIGFIYDDSNEVGQVHLAVVSVIHVQDSRSVRVRETNKMTGKFRSVDEILKEKHLYENWSQILIDHVILN
jgi:predicted NUDIX family phosphoesterase